MIVQEKCIKCGSCYTACPDKFRAVLKLPVAAVSRPIPIPQPQLETTA
jgi:Fe-S-cluster-containing hydrogenase component 2